MRKVIALDVVDQVVVDQPIAPDVEYANGVVAIALNQILSVAILIGLVDIGNTVRRTDRVEQVAAKGKYGVVDTKCRRDGYVKVDLLRQFLASERRDH